MFPTNSDEACRKGRAGGDPAKQFAVTWPLVGPPLETEVVEDTDSTCAINMTRCGFAEYFRAIGAADVGALLTCGVDFATEPVLRPDWEFRRSQTIMGGASHCDFRWRLRGQEGSGSDA